MYNKQTLIPQICLCYIYTRLHKDSIDQDNINASGYYYFKMDCGKNEHRDILYFDLVCFLSDLTDFYLEKEIGHWPPSRYSILQQVFFCMF